MNLMRPCPLADAPALGQRAQAVHLPHAHGAVLGVALLVLVRDGVLDVVAQVAVESKA